MKGEGRLMFGMLSQLCWRYSVVSCLHTALAHCEDQAFQNALTGSAKKARKQEETDYS